ncbi:MAG: choice-of-anchor tandem repeat GloVer-containing protein [Terriglobales bacterium]
MLFDSAGNIYGTASGGGANGLGVVFELSPAGSSWTEAVLYSFAGGADGANPANGLVMDHAGNLYGSTPSGGTAGTVFELMSSGSGWTEQVIYSDGGSTAGVTIDGAGNVYGVGLYPGRVFEVSPDGSGGWTSSVLYTFGPNYQGKYKYGAFPCGNLIFKDYGGLVGTAEAGGSEDWGVIYYLDSISLRMVCDRPQF